MPSLISSELVRTYKTTVLVSCFLRAILLPYVLIPFFVLLLGVGSGFRGEDLIFGALGALYGCLVFPLTRNALWERSFITCFFAFIAILLYVGMLAMILFVVRYGAYRSEFTYLFGPFIVIATGSFLAFFSHRRKYRMPLATYRHLRRIYAEQIVRRAPFDRWWSQHHVEGIFIKITSRQEDANESSVEEFRTMVVADVRDCFDEFNVRVPDSGRIAFTARNPDDGNLYVVYVTHLPAQGLIRVWVEKEKE